MRRFISAVLVSAALAGLFLVAPSIVTPSKASQAQAHGGVTNGCSVPGNPYWRDTPGGNNFHDACDQHDRCYVYHWYGEGETGRSWCDVYFSNDMGRVCAKIPWWAPGQRWSCANWNEIYYRAVRWRGTSYFNQRVPDVPVYPNVA
jgi:hypothetical protein